MGNNIFMTLQLDKHEATVLNRALQVYHRMTLDNWQGTAAQVQAVKALEKIGEQMKEKVDGRG